MQEEVVMNAKAQKFNAFLEAQKIQCFQTTVAQDPLNTVVFNSTMEINGNNLPVGIILDNSPYGMLRMQLVPRAAREENQTALLNYINEQNRTYKVFKYYLAENGDLCLDSCILLDPEQENGPVIYAVIDVVLKHLQEKYPEIMHQVWGK